MQNYLDSILVPSENVVAREIEKEFVVVPLTQDVVDMDAEIYTLNETGREIWKRLDGKNKLSDIIEKLSERFNSPPGEIEADIVGFTNELLKRKMLVEIKIR